MSRLYDAAYARKFAENIIGFLDDCCERIEIAGSLRRGRPQVHDIDLVCIPKIVERKVPSREGDLFPETKWIKVNLLAERLDALAKQGRISVTKAGKKYWSFTSAKSPVPIDVYFATEATFPIIFLIRTGSRAHNIKLIKHAEKMGMTLHAAGRLEYKDGDMSVEDEHDIFDALEMDYVKPENRE